jgi:hypothetical protein
VIPDPDGRGAQHVLHGVLLCILLGGVPGGIVYGQLRSGRRGAHGGTGTTPRKSYVCYICDRTPAVDTDSRLAAPKRWNRLQISSDNSLDIPPYARGTNHQYHPAPPVVDYYKSFSSVVRLTIHMLGVQLITDSTRRPSWWIIIKRSRPPSIDYRLRLRPTYPRVPLPYLRLRPTYPGVPLPYLRLRRYPFSPKKMYSVLKIITIVAIALLSTRSVDSLSQPAERTQNIFFVLNAENLDPLIGAGAAVNLISYLCSQPDDGIHEGMVSGAFNTLTREFMTWEQYRNTIGRDNDINTFYAAKAPWQTFWGKCDVKPHSTWCERGPTTFGNKRKNLTPTGSARYLEIAIEIPAFAGYTTLPSVQPYAGNPLAMNALFSSLGLPPSMTRGWTGLHRMNPVTQKHNHNVWVPGRMEKWFMATTSFRIVRAVEVFEVHQYNWNVAGDQGTADSWMNFGDGWESVYSSSGYIDGRGIHQQLPDSDSYVGLYILFDDLDYDDDGGDDGGDGDE